MSFCPGTGESPCQVVPKRREPRGHMRSSGFSAAEKSAVTAACQHLIDDFLKPRFLPTIRPTQFNYPVDILGKWHGTKYRFIQRYRSGFPENLGEEFDAPCHRRLKKRLLWEASSHTVPRRWGGPLRCLLESRHERLIHSNAAFVAERLVYRCAWSPHRSTIHDQRSHRFVGLCYGGQLLNQPRVIIRSCEVATVPCLAQQTFALFGGIVRDENVSH